MPIPNHPFVASYLAAQCLECGLTPGDKIHEMPLEKHFFQGTADAPGVCFICGEGAFYSNHFERSNEPVKPVTDVHEYVLIGDGTGKLCFRCGEVSEHPIHHIERNSSKIWYCEACAECRHGDCENYDDTYNGKPYCACVDEAHKRWAEVNTIMKSDAAEPEAKGVYSEKKIDEMLVNMSSTYNLTYVEGLLIKRLLQRDYDQVQVLSRQVHRQ